MGMVWFPTFETVGRPQTTILFITPIPVGGIITLASGRIPFKFRITRITFGIGALHLIYIFTSSNPNVSATALPPDTNVFTPYSPTPYLQFALAALAAADMAFIAPEDHHYIKVSFVLAGGAVPPDFVAISIEPTEVPA